MKQHSNPNQTSKILAYLQKGKALTPLDALNLFGCFRISARIYELRQMGHDIEMRILYKKGKKFSEYKLAK